MESFYLITFSLRKSTNRKKARIFFLILDSDIYMNFVHRSRTFCRLSYRLQCALFFLMKVLLVEIRDLNAAIITAVLLTSDKAHRLLLCPKEEKVR